MEQLLLYIVAMPFLGFLILTLSGKRSEKFASIVGIGSVGISAVLTIILGVIFLNSGKDPVIANIWEWIAAKDLSIDISFTLDPLSLVFIFVITFVGFLIHLYSSEYMSHDEGFRRFFAYMNLFIGSMLVLVLADNLILMYLGWEGVGLCSFLLIGFWYKEPENTAAARKAFIVTRIGDTAFAIGLFLLFMHFSTFNIQDISSKSSMVFSGNPDLSTALALLLLGGAVGKSAQLPLQTWLPDAMAGPTPVSALIHAATMVTAGVYLIARTNFIFIFSPLAMTITAFIGASTLIIAGISALVQYDIKKILAYSTISQIGYMFLALGLGAWSAGVFHFMTHAFFKALLFLAAGSVIIALEHEQNIFRMGGLKNRLKVTFFTFLIGAASLAALPLITAGFYSKDQILWYAYSGERGNIYLWIAGITGALITSVYSFRMVFHTFFGRQNTEIHRYSGKKITIPLILLAILSVIGGLVEIPENIGNLHLFSSFLNFSIPSLKETSGIFSETGMQILSGLLVIFGIAIAFIIFKRSGYRVQSEDIKGIKWFFFKGWGFDALYDNIVVKPYTFIAKINKNDFIDLIYTGIALLNIYLNRLLSYSQTGNTRWYVMGIAGGALLIILTIIVS